MNSNKINKPSLESLFEDFNHPNPQINKKASIQMSRYWHDEASRILINNLNHKDVSIRRKSVKALSFFGIDIVGPLCELFCMNSDEMIRVSCLKIFVFLAPKITINSLPKDLVVVIKLSIESDNPQIILSLICLLRQLEIRGVKYLKGLARDENLLKSKAAITALSEIKGSSIKPFLEKLIIDDSIDILSREAAIDGLKYID